MPIIVSCGCGRKFRAKEEHIGKRAKCPACGEALVISGPTEAKESQTPKPAVRKAAQATPAVESARAEPARKWSLEGLIVAAIVIVLGISDAFEGARAFESAAAREARLLRPFAVIMGGLAIGGRSFLPRITFGRGVCAWVAGAGLAMFLFMVGRHGVGRPGGMVALLLVPVLGAIFALRIGETRSERRRRQHQIESERAVRDAQALGRAASLCQDCRGTGRRGWSWMHEWRCRTCRGIGHLISATDDSPIE